jgi:GNAT superfamily N-acetyltransferase
MPVRLLLPSDLMTTASLLQQLGYSVGVAELASRMDRVIANPAHFAAVAEEDGAVRGLIHAYERPAIEKAYDIVVQSLVVDQLVRKAGLGKSLMMAAEAWARTRGVERVVLYTRVDRDDARAFYERIGYSLSATSHLMCRPISRD